MIVAVVTPEEFSFGPGKRDTAVIVDASLSCRNSPGFAGGVLCIENIYFFFRLSARLAKRSALVSRRL